MQMMRNAGEYLAGRTNNGARQTETGTGWALLHLRISVRLDQIELILSCMCCVCCIAKFKSMERNLYQREMMCVFVDGWCI